MHMKLSTWNFQRIRDAVAAAENAQTANYEDLANQILFRLADEIIKNKSPEREKRGA
jgi:hypothetical protein